MAGWQRSDWIGGKDLFKNGYRVCKKEFHFKVGSEYLASGWKIGLKRVFKGVLVCVNERDLEGWLRCD